MPGPITALGIPIESARMWSNALVPDGAGGWIYVAFLYNFPNTNPVECVVMHLGTGVYQIYTDANYVPGTRGHYPNENFTIKNQLRAPDGGVFWPAISGWWWHLNPNTWVVTDMGRIPGATDSLWYAARPNHDGSKLLGGTLATTSSARRPEMVWVDTATLAMTVGPRVGSLGRLQNGYLYYVWYVGSWPWGLVGQGLWELISVDPATKVQTIHASASVDASAAFVQKAGGLVARLFTNFSHPNQTVQEFWCLEDGTTAPYTGGETPPAPHVPIDVTPYDNPIVDPPELDESQLPECILWRPHGSTGEWTRNDIAIAHAAPIPIESIVTLPDGDIFGDAQQYQGFLRRNTRTGIITVSGAFAGVTEGRARLVHDGVVHIVGYPNGSYYRFYPSLPFSATNPKRIGEFSNGISLSGVKRASVIVWSEARNRLYMAGQRDRSGFGAGLGFYDEATKTFGGVDANTEFLTGDLGLTVFDNLGLCVMGGLIADNPSLPGQAPTSSQIIISDLDLNERDRQSPVPGLDSGNLFRTTEPDVIVGICTVSKLMYRWNIITKALLKAVDLGAFGSGTEIAVQPAGPGGSILSVLGGKKLASIDPVTLNYNILADLTNTVATYGSIGALTQAPSGIYMGAGSTLLHLALTDAKAPLSLIGGVHRA